MSTSDMDDFLQMFLQESADRFEEMNQAFLCLERSPHDEQTLYSILRSIHSLKGSAGMFGFEHLKQVAHRLEDLLQQVHRIPQLVDQETIDLLFEGCDILQEDFRTIIAHGVEDDVSPREEAFLKRINTWLGRGGGTGGLTDSVTQLVVELEQLLQPHRSLSDAECASLQRHMAEVRRALQMRTPDARQDTPETPAALQYELGGRDVTAAWTTLADATQRARQGALAAEVSEEAYDAAEEIVECAWGHVPEDFVETLEDARESLCVFRDMGDGFDDIAAEFYGGFLEALAPHAQHATVLASSASAEKVDDLAAAVSGRRTVRVDESRIDAFLNDLGELIVLGEVFNNLFRRIAPTVPPGQAGQVRSMQGALAEYGKHVFSLQGSLMSLRRVPVANMTGALSRLVRDTAQLLGKKVEFHLDADNAVVDKSHLDDVNSCLVHLVRNACDHGLEVPAARLAADKPEMGRISLRAWNEGEMLRLRLEDDGGGIDVEALRAKAIASGALARSEVERMSDAEAAYLIFHDGVSTADEISQVSGRGVGMAAVKDLVTRIGGTVTLENHPGRGVVVELQVPLSVMLAVVDGLVVRRGVCAYILPLQYVVESFVAREEERVDVPERGVCLPLRDRLYPLRHLPVVGGEVPDGSAGIGILLQHEKSCGCILVDEVLDHQQVVIKRIEGLGHLRGLKGGALLGDGSIGLVLDVPGLLAE